MGLMVLLSTTILAETIRADYDVSYGIFGKIGRAKATLKKERSRYRIEIGLEPTGLAKRLSGNRTERHTSEGRIVNGKLVSDRYTVIRTSKDTKVIKRYRFDHSKRRIYKRYLKYKRGVLAKDEKETLSFYTSEDLLTLYFNLDKLLPDKQKAGRYRFYAVGAERQKGEVFVEIPSQKRVSVYEKELGKGASWYATVLINQQIFTSKEGRLQLAVGKDGITRTALLKDVIFFGDIRARRVK